MYFYHLHIHKPCCSEYSALQRRSVGDAPEGVKFCPTAEGQSRARSCGGVVRVSCLAVTRVEMPRSVGLFLALTFTRCLFQERFVGDKCHALSSGSPQIRFPSDLVTSLTLKTHSLVAAPFTIHLWFCLQLLTLLGPGCFLNFILP